MNAWIKKELQQVLVPCLTIGILGAILLSIWGSEWLVLTPISFNRSDSSSAVAFLITPLAGLLGWYQFRAEQVHGTLSFLIHRDGGHVAAFRAKVLAGWLLLLAGCVLWLAAIQLSCVLRADSASAEWTQLAKYGLIALVAFPAHATGAMCSQLRLNPVPLVFLTGMPFSGVIASAMLISRPLGTQASASIWLYLAVLALLSALLLWIALQMFRAGPDSDQAFAPKLNWLVGAVCVISGTLWLESMLGTYQAACLDRAEDEWPALAVDKNNQVHFVRYEPKGWIEVDPDSGAEGPVLIPGRYTAILEDNSPLRLVYAPETTPLTWSKPSGDPSQLRVGEKPFAFFGSWQRLSIDAEPQWRAWFSSHRRQVLMVHGDRPREQRLWLEPQLSPKVAIVYNLGGSTASTLLVDLAQGRLWQPVVNSTGPQLVERSLPAGDRILGVEQLQSRSRARAGLWEPFGYSDMLVIVGSHGRYQASADGPIAWNGDPGLATPDEFAALVEHRAERIGGDRYAPILALYDARTGQELLRHRMEPFSLTGQAFVILARSLGLLRSPLASMAGLWSDPTVIRTDEFELRTHGTRPIWWLHLLLAAALCIQVGRRLDGLPRWYQLFWILCVGVSGCLGWLLCLALEPARRTSSAAQLEALRPAPLLTSQ